MNDNAIAEPALERLKTFGAARYIKLGAEGAYSAECLRAGELALGFATIPHALCQAGDWDGVHAAFKSQGKSQQKASDHTRELRDFYTLGEDVLWITFADGLLWWTFAAPGVSWRDAARDLPRRRKTMTPWRSSDLLGRALRTRDLSTRLTSVRGYRSTICDVTQRDYLLRKLQGETDPLIDEAERVLTAAHAVAAKLIRQLHEKEFELLVDLIFANSGWRRLSILGETEADVDLIVEERATGQRAFVQVKSRATPQIFESYVERFRDYGSCDRMFFVCHSPSRMLRAAQPPESVDLWFEDQLAVRVARAGLLEWIIARTR